MLLLFFFFPHSWATASDFKNLKTPSDRSSHLINPGFFSGLRRISRINSQRWVPRGSEKGKRRGRSVSRASGLCLQFFLSSIDSEYSGHSFWSTRSHLRDIQVKNTGSFSTAGKCWPLAVWALWQARRSPSYQGKQSPNPPTASFCLWHCFCPKENMFKPSPHLVCPFLLIPAYSTACNLLLCGTWNSRDYHEAGTEPPCI